MAFLMTNESTLTPNHPSKETACIARSVLALLPDFRKAQENRTRAMPEQFAADPFTQEAWGILSTTYLTNHILMHPDQLYAHWIAAADPGMSHDIIPLPAIPLSGAHLTNETLVLPLHAFSLSPKTDAYQALEAIKQLMVWDRDLSPHGFTHLPTTISRDALRITLREGLTMVLRYPEGNFSQTEWPYEFFRRGQRTEIALEFKTTSQAAHKLELSEITRRLDPRRLPADIEKLYDPYGVHQHIPLILPYQKVTPSEIVDSLREISDWTPRRSLGNGTIATFLSSDGRFTLSITDLPYIGKILAAIHEDGYFRKTRKYDTLARIESALSDGTAVRDILRQATSDDPLLLMANPNLDYTLIDTLLAKHMEQSHNLADVPPPYVAEVRRRQFHIPRDISRAWKKAAATGIAPHLVRATQKITVAETPMSIQFEICAQGSAGDMNRYVLIIWTDPVTNDSHGLK